MRWVADSWLANRDFIEAGGPVLLAIIAVVFAMWTLILERYWYLWRGHRAAVERVMTRWEARADKLSWNATQIRRAMVSRICMDLHESVPAIKTLIAICPLLGLLGTVTGMIEVFEVMALSGSGNTRAMASGVSRATIPTLAGMVGAISGFIFSSRIERRAERAADQVADQLGYQGGVR